MKNIFGNYLGKNIISILTIIIGCSSLILTQLKILPQATIGATTLTLVIFLTTSQLKENSRKLEKIDKSISDGYQNIIKTFDGVEIIKLDEPENGLLYLAERINNAKKHIDHASLSQPIPRNNIGAKEWEKAIEKILLTNKIPYRYVCTFFDEIRLERINKHLGNSKIKKYFVGYFPKSMNSIPMPNFILIDDVEVIAIFPYDYGETEVWLSIKHPEVVKMFESYFRRLWHDCTTITLD